MPHPSYTLTLIIKEETPVSAIEFRIQFHSRIQTLRKPDSYPNLKKIESGTDP